MYRYSSKMCLLYWFLMWKYGRFIVKDERDLIELYLNQLQNATAVSVVVYITLLLHCCQCCLHYVSAPFRYQFNYSRSTILFRQSIWQEMCTERYGGKDGAQNAEHVLHILHARCRWWDSHFHLHLQSNFIQMSSECVSRDYSIYSLRLIRFHS